MCWSQEDSWECSYLGFVQSLSFCGSCVREDSWGCSGRSVHVPVSHVWQNVSNRWGSMTAENAPVDEAQGGGLGWLWSLLGPVSARTVEDAPLVCSKFLMWSRNVSHRRGRSFFLTFFLVPPNLMLLDGEGVLFFFKLFFWSPPTSCCSQGESMPVERRNILKKKKKKKKKWGAKTTNPGCWWVVASVWDLDDYAPDAVGWLDVWSPYGPVHV